MKLPSDCPPECDCPYCSYWDFDFESGDYVCKAFPSIREYEEKLKNAHRINDVER